MCSIRRMMRYVLTAAAAIFFLAAWGCGESESPRGEPGPPAAASPGRAELDAMLSGTTLERYRALPAGFQEALAAYVWHGAPRDLVPLAVMDKMDQWGGGVVPLPEMLGEARAQKLRALESQPNRYANLLLSYYVYVSNTEPSDVERVESMQEMVDVMLLSPSEAVVRLSPGGDPLIQSMDVIPEASIPSLDSVLTKTALARLDRHEPRIKEALHDMGSIGSGGQTDILNLALFLTRYEMFMLKVEPGSLEMPSIESVLTADEVSTFLALPQEGRNRVATMFRRSAIMGYVAYVASQRAPVESSSIVDALGDMLSDYAITALEFATLTQGGETVRDAGPLGWVIR